LQPTYYLLDIVTSALSCRADQIEQVAGRIIAMIPISLTSLNGLAKVPLFILLLVETEVDDDKNTEGSEPISEKDKPRGEEP